MAKRATAVARINRSGVWLLAMSAHKVTMKFIEFAVMYEQSTKSHAVRLDRPRRLMVGNSQMYVSHVRRLESSNCVIRQFVWRHLPTEAEGFSFACFVLLTSLGSVFQRRYLL